MPGHKITDRQVDIYMNNRKSGKTQTISAAKADFSVRSGRDIEKNMRSIKKQRRPSIKKNQIDKVFDSVIVPLLEEHDYQASFLLEHIQAMYSVEEYPNSLLRTLQRRKKEWESHPTRLKHKEVMFAQEHKPGRLTALDFTHPNDKARVTIKGKPFKHIIFHMRLAYSGLSYAEPFRGSGESFEKLAQGINNGFEYFGGVTKILRTDSLSAAFKNLKKSDKVDQTKRYQALTDHYGLEVRRINRGKSHENGSIESPHGHLKEYIRQSLAIRGSRDFDSFEDYQAFIFQIVEKRNLRRKSSRVSAERASLNPLPRMKGIGYTEVSTNVPSSSMITIKNAVYAVPDIFITEDLLVRVYSDKLECYHGQYHVLTLDRAYSTVDKKPRNIDPKYLVRALFRKSQAFRHYIYRDDLLRNYKYRYIWEYIDPNMEERAACKLMARILKLAYTHNCEEELADYIIDRIHLKKELNINYLENKFMSKQKSIPLINVAQHVLSEYNELIQQGDK